MKNKIRKLCEKIDNLRVGESFSVKSNCKGIICCECPFIHTSCEYITKESFEIYQATARKWLEFNSDELELYQKEQSKTYNIIEALKLPVGTKLKITFPDGSETTGYLKKYGEENATDVSLTLMNTETNAIITNYYTNETYTVIDYTNATYTVIEDKPISFFEAVQQADKRRFKIEHELYKAKGCHTLLTHTNILKDLNNNEVKDIMLNAKCYLEE